MGIMVQFRANSFVTGHMTEEFLCNVTIGGERKPKTVFHTMCAGDFQGPQLNFSEHRLYFKYIWEKHVDSMPIAKTLDISNVGTLPTTVMLKITPPFSCSQEELTLP